MTINYIVSHLQAMLLCLRAGYTDIYVQQTYRTAELLANTT